MIIIYLNIPRYVDTFEAEDSVDIEAVAERIKELDGSMVAMDAEIADFCRQLNITSPF